MATPKSAHGTLLKRGNGGSPETFTTVAKVQDIAGPGFSLGVAMVHGQEETTHFTRKIGTILEAGQITFDIVFDPGDSGHSPSAGLLYDMLNRTVRNFQLVFPDALSSTWSFAALVTGFQPSMAQDGALMASVTLDIDGKPSFA